MKLFQVELTSDWSRWSAWLGTAILRYNNAISSIQCQQRHMGLVSSPMARARTVCSAASMYEADAQSLLVWTCRVDQCQQGKSRVDKRTQITSNYQTKQCFSSDDKQELHLLCRLAFYQACFSAYQEWWKRAHLVRSLVIDCKAQNQVHLFLENTLTQTEQRI